MEAGIAAKIKSKTKDSQDNTLYTDADYVLQ